MDRLEVKELAGRILNEVHADRLDPDPEYLRQAIERLIETAAWKSGAPIPGEVRQRVGADPPYGIAVDVTEEA